MKTNYEIRYAAHPEDAKQYDTTRIRRDFLIERVFAADEVLGDQRVYNLNGQHVENAKKGIYIVNGKKVVIK